MGKEEYRAALEREWLRLRHEDHIRNGPVIRTRSMDMPPYCYTKACPDSRYRRKPH